MQVKGVRQATCGLSQRSSMPPRKASSLRSHRDWLSAVLVHGGACLAAFVGLGVSPAIFQPLPLSENSPVWSLLKSDSEEVDVASPQAHAQRKISQRIKETADALPSSVVMEPLSFSSSGSPSKGLASAPFFHLGIDRFSVPLRSGESSSAEAHLVSSRGL